MLREGTCCQLLVHISKTFYQRTPCALLQATSRADMFAGDGCIEYNVPVSQDSHMTVLRAAFRAADERERNGSHAASKDDYQDQSEP